MTLDPGVDEAFPLVVRSTGQLEDVAVELDAHPSVHVCPEPAPDGAYDRGERLRVPGEADDERAQHERLDRARPVRCGTRCSVLDGVDVEVEQLCSEALGEPLELDVVGSGAEVDREREFRGFAVQAWPPLDGDDSCYRSHKPAKRPDLDR